MADVDHSGSGFDRGSTYAYPAPHISTDGNPPEIMTNLPKRM